jgi:hypothetical protein
LALREFGHDATLQENPITNSKNDENPITNSKNDEFAMQLKVNLG